MATGSNMVKLVVQLLADAKDFANELTAASDAVKKMAGAAGQDLAAVSAEVGEATAGAAGEVAKGIDAAGAEVKEFADGVEADVEQLAMEFEETGEALAREMEEGAEKAGEAIDGEMKEAGDSIDKEIAEGAEKAGDALGKELKEGATEAATAVDSVPEKSKSAWGKLTAAAAGAAAGMAASFKESAGDINMSMREATNKVAEDVSSMAGRVGTSMMAMGGAVLGALALAANGARDIQNALGEVASVGITDMDMMTQAGMDFSNTWAGTTAPEFISAAYDVKSAISTLSDDAVADFTEMAGITAKATKSTIDEMTKAFATGYGILKPLQAEMGDSEWAEGFAGAMATAVSAYKTEGKQMADSLKSLGATATVANVPLEEQLGILGTLQTTMSGAEAGTKYKSFLNNITKAGEELNLQFLNSNGTLKSTPEILELIKQKFPDLSQAAAQMKLKEAFGEEGSALVKVMIPSLDQLKSGIEEIGSGFEQGAGKATEMAEAMNTDKVALAKQQFDNLKASIGLTVMEAFAPLLESFSEWLLMAQQWVKDNPELVEKFVKLAAVIGFVLVAIGAVLGVFAAGAAVVAVFTSAAMVTVVAFVSAWGLLIAGIVAALVAFGLYVHKYWDEIKMFFGYLWDGIKEIFSAAWYWIVEMITGAWDNIVDLFKRNIELLKDLWNGFWDALGHVWDTAVEGVDKFTSYLVDGIKEAVEKCKQFLLELWTDIKNLPGELWGGVKDFFGGGDDEAAPASAGASAMRAPSLPSAGGAAASMAAGAAAMTAPGAGAAGAAAEGPIEVNIYQQPGQDPADLLKDMARELRFRRGGRS